MERESKKLEIISEIYTRFSKENKEKLIKSATGLLKVQKEDAGMLALADAPPSQNEGKKAGLE
jgi:hypothetical protein